MAAQKQPNVHDKYLIVTWKDKPNYGSIISSTWLDGTQCALWPDYSDESRRLQAAKKQEVPGSEWRSFPIGEKFEYETDNWDKAIERLRRLRTKGSVLTTDPEDLGPGKRTKSVPARYEHERTESQMSQPKRKRAVLIESSESEEDSVSDGLFALSVPAPPKGPLASTPHAKEQAKRSQPSNKSAQSHDQFTYQHRSRSAFENSFSVADHAAASTSTVPVTVVKDMFSTIIKELAGMRVDVRQLMRKVNRHSASGVPSADTSDDQLDVKMFPLSTAQEIHDFEAKLGDPVFQQKVRKFIGVYSACTIREEVNNIIGTVFHVDMQEKYNLSGAGSLKKKAFDKLRFFSLLQALEKEHFPKEGDFKKVFRNAVSDYLLGVKYRTKSSENPQEVMQRAHVQGPANSDGDEEHEFDVGEGNREHVRDQ